MTFSLVRVSAIAALTPLHAAALPSFQSRIPNGYNVQRNGETWPGIGHEAQRGGRSLNSFGQAFADAGYIWTVELCNEDTDGDGFTNGAELGDPACKWTEGATPHRTTYVSHPGYSDSTPHSHHAGVTKGLSDVPEAQETLCAPNRGTMECEKFVGDPTDTRLWWNGCDDVCAQDTLDCLCFCKLSPNGECVAYDQWGKPLKYFEGKKSVMKWICDEPTCDLRNCIQKLRVVDGGHGLWWRADDKHRDPLDAFDTGRYHCEDETRAAFHMHGSKKTVLPIDLHKCTRFEESNGQIGYEVYTGCDASSAISPSPELPLSGLVKPEWLVSEEQFPAIDWIYFRLSGLLALEWLVFEPIVVALLCVCALVLVGCVCHLRRQHNQLRGRQLLMQTSSEPYGSGVDRGLPGAPLAARPVAGVPLYSAPEAADGKLKEKFIVEDSKSDSESVIF